MLTVGIHEAKTHLSRLLERVVAGEEVIISKSGSPIARLTPINKPAQERQAGIDAGKGFVVPDDFDDPLPEEILRDFGL